jgi:RNA-binding protein Nova
MQGPPQQAMFFSPGPAAASSNPRMPGGAVRGPCFIKLLVQDRLAGVIIGKGGSGIADLEQATGATMRLSGSRVYFPGTTERVMVGGGEMHAIENLISMLVEKLNEHSSGSEHPVILRLVLTNSACAAVIGKGGDVIKNISQKTGANLRASDRSPNTQERILEAKGANVNQVTNAVRDIVHLIQEDASFREFASVLNYYTGAPEVVGINSSYYYPQQVQAPGQSLAAAAGAAGAQAAAMPSRTTGITALIDQYPISIDFTVPSTAVGAIIGKNGDARNRIVHSTGANLVVSERTADPMAERKITISGPLAAVQAALTLVAGVIVEAGGA